MLLQDKVALITGASKGIGQATAQMFSEQGASVILHGRDEQALTDTANDIEQITGKSPLILRYDVKDDEKVKKVFQAIKKEMGALDILVNNAGMMEEGPLGLLKKENIRMNMETNVNAVLTHMQMASRLMMGKRSGAIINVSSIIGRNGAPGNVLYSSSKAAVIGATKSASKELAPYGIRVNAVAPGFVHTDLTKHYADEKYENVIRQIGMKRGGDPKEVASVMLFLASELSSYVTGQVIGVDGGMVI